MSEYWKSQAKKFCEICKCWFADNKVSVQFHENGNRHKAAVAAKLRDLGRKGKEKEREEQQLTHTLIQMEMAAHKATEKDKDKSATTSVPTGGLGPGGVPHAMYMGPVLPPAARVVSESKASKNVVTYYTEPERDNQMAPIEDRAWAETISEDGHVYYWNVNTGETKWEPPGEGFVSVAEQKILEQREEAQLYQKAAERICDAAHEAVPLIEEEEKSEEDKKVTGFTSGFVGNYSTVAVDVPKLPEFPTFDPSNLPQSSNDIPQESTDQPIQEDQEPLQQEAEEESGPSVLEQKLLEYRTNRPSPYGAWSTVSKAEGERKIKFGLSVRGFETPESQPQYSLKPKAKNVDRDAKALQRIKFSERTVSSVQAKSGKKSTKKVAFKKKGMRTQNRGFRTKE